MNSGKVDFKIGLTRNYLKLQGIRTQKMYIFGHFPVL